MTKWKLKLNMLWHYISTQEMKYLGKKTTKCVLDINKETYKILINKFKNKITGEILYFHA